MISTSWTEIGRLLQLHVSSWPMRTRYMAPSVFLYLSVAEPMVYFGHYLWAIMYSNVINIDSKLKVANDIFKKCLSEGSNRALRIFLTSEVCTGFDVGKCSDWVAVKVASVKFEYYKDHYLTSLPIWVAVLTI